MLCRVAALSASLAPLVLNFDWIWSEKDSVFGFRRKFDLGVDGDYEPASYVSESR